MDSHLVPVSSDFCDRDGSPRSWWHGLDFIGAWRERIVAARLCHALRALYQKARALDPNLQGAALYEQVVQQHLGLPAEEAARVVGLVAENYASWPAPRPVTFRDVAHYLASTKLLAHRGWIAADVRQVINRRLPAVW